MFKDFHLVAIINGENGVELQAIPFHRRWHSNLSADWYQQYDTFIRKDEQQFSASWKLGKDEYFVIHDHELSENFTEINIGHFINVEMVNLNVNLIDSITGIVACVMDQNNNQIMLFQRFMKSQVFKPGTYYSTGFTREDAFVGETDDMLTFRNKLTAVYYIENKTLLVDSIYNAKAFLPSLSKYYNEASDDMIRDTLSHRLIECEDREKVVDVANQTIRRQFAMIEESGILDRFSAIYIQEKAAEGNVEIWVQNDKIVFPTDNKSIKAVLVCLCDGLVRSLLTDEVYETNSKKKVDV